MIREHVLDALPVRPLYARLDLLFCYPGKVLEGLVWVDLPRQDVGFEEEGDSLPKAIRIFSSRLSKE